ncbi:MAG: L-rhamnose mutarotase [Clostridiaceae bacterium]|nr:L-rhamnose mutarotase [Clostridiaceae bacterium]
MTNEQHIQRVAWHAHIKPGSEQEYKHRHDHIWPEMTAVLNEAGIHNYTVWLCGNELFGYYECPDPEKAARVQAASPVVDRWNEYMKDILTMDFDPETGVTPPLKQMFYHA